MANSAPDAFSSYSYSFNGSSILDMVDEPLRYHKTVLAPINDSKPNRNGDVYSTMRNRKMWLPGTDSESTFEPENRINHLLPGGFYQQLIDKVCDCYLITILNALRWSGDTPHTMCVVVCDFQDISIDSFSCRVLESSDDWDLDSIPRFRVMFSKVSQWERVNLHL